LEKRPGGGFGLSNADNSGSVLSLVLLNPDFQQIGIGTAMIHRTIMRARPGGKPWIEIGAIHLSAPFLAWFGAKILSENKHRWGPNWHRIEMDFFWINQLSG
jgi:GNAT superfamily N-acetyltransferase